MAPLPTLAETQPIPVLTAVPGGPPYGELGSLEAWPLKSAIDLPEPTYADAYPDEPGDEEAPAEPIVGSGGPVIEAPQLAEPLPYQDTQLAEQTELVATGEQFPRSVGVLPIEEPFEGDLGSTTDRKSSLTEEPETRSTPQTAARLGLFGSPDKIYQSVTEADLSDPAAVLARHATSEELMLDTPSAGRVTQLVTPDVQEAYTLGRHGALYAARTRFVAVLQKIARAKDAEQTTTRHVVSLAAGLRALEEAQQFAPTGAEIDTEVDVSLLAASHTTPLYRQAERSQWMLPNEAIARYHRYAQHKLSFAVSGDQAGSMALHGLGKTFARMAETDNAPLAGRTSLTMYRAAVETHRGNYLAANELGVGLAQAGHYSAARQTLERAITSGAGSTTYRNLAVVQRKLGQPRLAAAAEARAERLAIRERAAGEFSRQRGVQWVNRQQLARVSDAYGSRPPAAALAAQATSPNAAVASPEPKKRSIADRIMPWRRTQTTSLGPAVPTNQNVAPVRSQTIVR